MYGDSSMSFRIKAAVPSLVCILFVLSDPLSKSGNSTLKIYPECCHLPAYFHHPVPPLLPRLLSRPSNWAAFSDPCYPSICSQHSSKVILLNVNHGMLFLGSKPFSLFQSKIQNPLQKGLSMPSRAVPHQYSDLHPF